MKKIFFVLMLIASLTASSQFINDRNALYFGLGGGLHGFHYSMPETVGNSHSGMGGMIEVKYQRSFLDQFGLSVGLQVSSSRGKASLSFCDSVWKTSNTGVGYWYHTQLDSLREVQNGLMLTIPVELFMSQDLGGGWSLQTSVGMYGSLPLFGKCRLSSGRVITSGYFPEQNVTVTDIPTYGFGTHFSDSVANRGISFTPSFGFLAEIMLKKTIDDWRSLCFGVYLQYGLSGLSKADSLGSIWDADAYSYRGIMNSNHISDVNSIMFGVKAGLQFGGFRTTEVGQENGAVLQSFEDERNTLKSTIANDSAQIVKLQKEKETLQKEIDRLKQLPGAAEKEQLLQKVRRADSLTIRIMRNRLMSRYSKTNVEEAMDDYNHISSPEIKAAYRNLYDMLKRYGSDYEQLKAVLGQAQSLVDQTDYVAGPDVIRACQANCKKLLNGLSYYKEYYPKKNSYYLDFLIDAFLFEINRMNGRPDPNTGNIYMADFTLLLKMM